MSTARLFRVSKPLFFSALAILLMLSFSAAGWAVRSDNRMPRTINAKLAERLAKARPGQTFDVILKLAPIKTGLSASTGGDMAHSKAVRVLKDRSFAKQKQLLAQIKSAKAAGAVKSARRFWVANAIAVKADAASVKALAARPEVQKVFPNFRVAVGDPMPNRGGVAPSAGNEWNIDKIGAPAVWSTFSTTGTGAKVAILDTGIDDTHPDLAGKVDEFVQVDEYGNATTTTPTDTDAHGTHVSGIVAGSGGIGVAPGARLMGAIVLPGGGGTYAQVLGGMEWAADPDGNPATADQPDVANMSWGSIGLVYQFIEPIDNLVAAGVFPAVAAGNWGEGWVSGPGDVPTAFAVGATDKNDAVPWWSSGGEVTWYEPPHAGVYTKPDASAPGAAVRSSVPGGGYAIWSGTSMATPHMAGAAALLRSLDPSLTVGEISSILQSTALDLGAEGKDTRYGSGRIDVPAAAGLAVAFGTVEGTVTVSAETTQATVKVVSDPTGTVVAALTANGTGRYDGVVAPGDYRLEVSKYGFSTTSSPVFTLTAGGDYAFSPDLQVAPRHTLSGSVTAAGGGASLAATITVMSPIAISTPTAGGAYALSVPDGTYRLRAGAFGYKNKDATVTVSGGNVVQDFALDKVSPTLLVLDVGAGTRLTIFGPYRAYFTDALDAAGATYDVVDLSGDTPDPPEVDGGFLSQYKSVVWATGDGWATGAMDQWNPLTDKIVPPALASYLDNGGKLLITGQDVAFYLGWMRLQQTRTAMSAADILIGGDFLSTYLHARLIKDSANNRTVGGKPGTLFAGKSMKIMGGNGADNQIWPDVIGTDGISVAELAYTTETTGAASLRTYSGQGDNGKVVYFSFGLEAVDNLADRADALDTALDWLNAPAGVLSISASPSKIVGPAPVGLSGTLSPGLAGERITVEQRVVSFPYPGEGEGAGTGPMDGGLPGMPEPTVEWLPVADATTTGGGNWDATVFPQANSTYRAVWDGNLALARSVSAEKEVLVQPLILAAPAKRVVSAGAKTYIQGTITPVPRGMVNVSLLSKPLGAGRWRPTSTYVSVDPGGFFSVQVQPTRHTKYRLSLHGGEELLSAMSAPMVVRTRHNLTIRSETGLVQRDVEIFFSGRILPKHARGKLELQRLAAGAWKTVAAVRLTGSSSYKIPYVGSKVGSFSFRVRLAGDRRHSAGFSEPVRVRFY